MNTQIEIEGQNTPFTLVWAPLSWQSSKTPEEAEFPLIAFMDGKRYELYSDGTFAEVEK